jgi:Tol biopolymer transport system component
MKRLIACLFVGMLVLVACGADDKGSPTGFFGKSLTQLTTTGGQAPEWSPDGNSIVYVFQDDLWMIDPVEGSTPVQLTSTSERESQPAWHTDSGTRKIVFTKTADSETFTISTLDVDSSDEPVDIYSAGKRLIQPTYTNDGTKIAFTSPSVNAGVSLVPVSGDGEPVKIDNSESWDNLISAACSPTAPVVAYVRIRTTPTPAAISTRSGSPTGPGTAAR